MYNKKGFTLLELLIAAALIGVLAMFATQAFRSSASDVRVEDAKARALALAMAAQRYYIEYPNSASFSTGESNALKLFDIPEKQAKCNINASSASAQNLVDCGFLEYRQIACDGKSSEGTFCNVTMWFDSIDRSNAEVTVCFRGKGRITDKKKYCTSGGAFTVSGE
ncbi:MAG: prepilin-type N-terminal cleavage/methylation domain-containing protein [Elusimicrobiaceae bacterium]|nr:prepilin-type N-terminal cleavage/methylation domain-containing protein [Elusimicrobiaceae bacterium]